MSMMAYGPNIFSNNTGVQKMYVCLLLLFSNVFHQKLLNEFVSLHF